MRSTPVRGGRVRSGQVTQIPNFCVKGQRGIATKNGNLFSKTNWTVRCFSKIQIQFCECTRLPENIKKNYFVLNKD